MVNVMNSTRYSAWTAVYLRRSDYSEYKSLDTCWLKAIAHKTKYFSIICLQKQFFFYFVI